MPLSRGLHRDVLVPAAAGVGLLLAASGLHLTSQTASSGSTGSELAPLAGPVVHDFGIVTIDGAARLLEHTFSLVNASPQPIRILRATSSCGCLVVSTEPEIVEPGETLGVMATLQLAQSGVKTELISLLTDLPEDPVIEFALRATGRRDRHFLAARRHLRLMIGGSTEMMVYAHQQPGHSEPPETVLPADAGLDVEVGPWFRPPADPGAPDAPVLWSATLMVRTADDAAPGRRQIIIGLRGEPTVTISVDLVTPIVN